MYKKRRRYVFYTILLLFFAGIARIGDESQAALSKYMRPYRKGYSE